MLLKKQRWEKKGAENGTFKKKKVLDVTEGLMESPFITAPGIPFII